MNFSKSLGSQIWKVVPCPTKSIVCLIFAWLNNFSGIEILPSLSNWRFTLSAKTEVAKISLFSSNGFNESIILNQTIRKDIKDKLNELTRSNFAPDCLIPLVDKDKEIDHRWGRKDSPLYSRINDTKEQTIDDFQLLSHSHNQFKREKCKKCTETNKRFDGIIWDDSVGCSGCPLAQPELDRGVLI